MTLAIIATVPMFFGDVGREGVIVTGLLLMIWVADLPSLPVLNRATAALATSSIYIYLTHWQIFRPIDDISLPLALLASLAFGIAYAMLVPRAAAKVAKTARSSRLSATAARSARAGLPALRGRPARADPQQGVSACRRRPDH
nr:hypothetical protein [Micromonospora veneta]